MTILNDDPLSRLGGLETAGMTPESLCHTIDSQVIRMLADTDSCDRFLELLNISGPERPADAAIGGTWSDLTLGRGTPGVAGRARCSQSGTRRELRTSDRARVGWRTGP